MAHRISLMLIKKIQILQMHADQSCAVCSQQFTHTNLAWIISLCGHNICNQCLKHCLTLKVKSITCKECKCKYNVDQQILEEFPKNITILKSLRDSKNISSVAESKNTKNEKTSIEGSLLLSNQSSKLAANNCQKHGKPLQIICTVDRGLLCAHCALFGQHQNHTFKTLQQFQTQLKTYKATYKDLQQKKLSIQQSVRSKKYKSSLITKISSIKDKLVIEIRDRFAKLAALIKDAENKVFQELVKCFRSVDSQISKITKQEQQCQKQYSRWKKQVHDYIKSIEEMAQIKNKIQIFYRPNRPVLNDGLIYFKQLQKSFHGIKQAVDQKIESIQVEYNVGIEGHIYNYANILVNPNQLKLKAKNMEQIYNRDTEELKYGKKQMKIEFVKNNQLDSLKQIRSVEKEKEKKQEILKSNRGNNLHKVKSNPKLPKVFLQTPKRVATPPKNHIKSTEHPKHEQNLQHAQRMLSEFLSSSDTLDLTSCELSDQQLHHIISQAAKEKPIKCLKLGKNKLTNVGLTHIIEFLSSVTNINLAYNGLTDECIDIFVEKRQYMPCLRIINLSHNKVNERKVKAKVEELKKIGVITTL